MLLLIYIYVSSTENFSMFYKAKIIISNDSTGIQSLPKIPKVTSPVSESIGNC